VTAVAETANESSEQIARRQNRLDRERRIAKQQAVQKAMIAEVRAAAGEDQGSTIPPGPAPQGLMGGVLEEWDESLETEATDDLDSIPKAP